MSGQQKPSEANRAAFERAVAEVTAITVRLLREELHTKAQPRDREIERERAKERGQARDARILAKR